MIKIKLDEAGKYLLDIINLDEEFYLGDMASSSDSFIFSVTKSAGII